MNEPEVSSTPPPAFYKDWRQGFFISKEALVELGLIDEANETAVGIVTSHDCDIGALPDKEPDVEIIIGESIEAIGEYGLLKNPRLLDLEVGGVKLSYCHLSALGKTQINKADIPDNCIDSSRALSSSNQRLFVRWLSARYRRSAFPNSFEKRLEKNNTFRKIQNSVNKRIQYIDEILFRVGENDGKELSDDEIYELGILIVIKSFDDQEARRTAEREVRLLAEELKKIFEDKYIDKKTKDWHSIELSYCDATTASGLSYEYFNSHQPWRLEHLSRDADIASASKVEIASTEIPSPSDDLKHEQYNRDKKAANIPFLQSINKLWAHLKKHPQ